MDKKQFLEIDELAKRYAKHGVTVTEITKQIKQLPRRDTFRKKLNAVRYWLAMRYNVDEYFTTKELAEVFGVTEKQILQFPEILGLEVQQISSSIPGFFGDTPGR